MSYRKSVFFARLKQISPCLSGFCEPGKRASQMLASIMPFAENASRAKTVLISEICVKKNLCDLCVLGGYKKIMALPVNELVGCKKKT